MTIEGGTDNPAAPPFDVLDRALVPLLNPMGAMVSVTLDRTGFFPARGTARAALLRLGVGLPVLRCGCSKVGEVHREEGGAGD